MPRHRKGRLFVNVTCISGNNRFQIRFAGSEVFVEAFKEIKQRVKENLCRNLTACGGNGSGSGINASASAGPTNAAVTQDSGKKSTITFWAAATTPERDTFWQSLNGVDFTVLPVEPFEASEGRWVGAKVGVFASGSGGGYLDIDWFRVTK
ncbi:hypothetical protein [Paenibacillus sp. Soil787]|uniref:beta-xylosidase family glycoside hydrolase n=1 Tax=Paenibacillus sp. Soil787 TaxID=1736411 RepID=UPI00070064AB|nr:hypothetical protein [Paenibacillus sp. Soil787]KRF42909.1 hypothetical protein ASG93_20340 [Paenibacillus sp. Soil787]